MNVRYEIWRIKPQDTVDTETEQHFSVQYLQCNFTHTHLQELDDSVDISM